MWGGSGGLGGFDGGHQVEDEMNGEFVADGGVEHAVVDGAVGPFDVEVFGDVVGAIAIDRVDELHGFGFGLAAGEEAANFIFAGGVEEDPEGVGAIAEEVLGAAADDDGVAGLRGIFDDALGDFQDAFAIDEIEVWRVEAAFVAAAQERFEEAVVERVGAFLTIGDDLLGAIGEAGDFFG